jgi:hypothetical protein
MGMIPASNERLKLIMNVEPGKTEKPVKPENKDELIVEQADLEQLAKAGQKPPKAKTYRIRIDDRFFVVSKSTMPGRELLVLAGKTPPESFILTQKSRGGALRTIELDDIVDFTTPGIERFNTLPRQVQEG